MTIVPPFRRVGLLCGLILAACPLRAAPPAISDKPLDDAAFQGALPPLDQVAAPPAPAPAVTVPTPSQPAASSPVAAPGELQAPLPPLAGFDPTPVPPTPAEAGKGDQPVKMKYSVEVTGLKQVGLEGDFRAASALLHDGSRSAANAAQIRARADEDVALAEKLLKAAGYYDGTATATVPARVAAGQPVPVAIVATPGPQYKLASVTLTGLARPQPYDMAYDALALKPGAPLKAQDVLDAEAHVSLKLPQQGYPFVKLGDRDILLDGQTDTANYTLPVNSGPLSSFGALRTKGDPVFALDHLSIFPRFKMGQVYDSRKVDDLRQALVATGMFSTVAIQPVDTGAKAGNGSDVVDLLVTQAAGKTRTLSGSAGYGTGEGVKLVGQWQSRNWSPPEGALIFDVTAGSLEQALGATFRRSDAGQRDRTFQTALTVSRQRYDAYNAETADLVVSLSRQSTPIWQKRWTYSYGAELLATRETPFVPNDPTRPNNIYYIAALPLQGGYDRSNSLLDPTTGFRVLVKLSPEAQKQNDGGFNGYLRSLGEVDVYHPLFTDNLTLAGRVRVGSIIGASRDSIAPSRRLYAGGGGSVRGYGYQQLGPKDANNNPIGGRSLTEFAVEARYRFGNYGVVPFLDGGRVGEGSTPSLSGMRYGVGIGARYYTNFGPFRLDVATPIGRQPGESKIAVYISIGQAF
jgi:translocation and assembly module TamA